MKVAVLIPAFNEGDTIHATVSAAWSVPNVTDVVVINDGSIDHTTGAAREAGAIVINLPHNMGKGAALNVGWKEVGADVYLLLDGDLGDSAVWAERLLAPVLAGQADMTIGRFGPQQGRGSGKMGFGFVRTFATWAIKRYSGKTIDAPLSGQRAIRAEVLKDIGGFAQGFGVEIALTIKAIWAGYQLMEVDVPMQHRPTGRGFRGFLHRGRQLVDIIRTLRRCLKERSSVC